MKHDKLGRKRTPSQDAALARINAERKKRGHRQTKPFVFYLPEEKAAKLEAMSKAERDAWAAKYLR